MGLVSKLRLFAKGCLRAMRLLKKKLEYPHGGSWVSPWPTKTDGGEGVSNPPPEVRVKIGSANRGRKRSPDTILKLKVARAKRGPPSEETKAKIGLSNKGKHCGTPTLATRLKMSDKAKSRPTISDETRQKLSEASRGRFASEVTREKMSKAQKGRAHPKHSEETKEKMRAARSGRKLTEEWKAAIKASWVIRKQRASTAYTGEEPCPV